MVERRPTILVFDSGLGGLTVHAEIAAMCPAAHLVYAADDAAFPYGELKGDTLVARILNVMERLIARFAPDLVVVACNTASTLALPHLRARFPLPFVGTVPAIKPAAKRSRTRLFSVLATPGTVARDYTRDLIETYAAECRVTLVGATGLAALAEAELAGVPARDAEILAEIAPAFVEDGEARTDVVVLGCTHYPLLLPRLLRLAPWPVTWIDPAGAIARRVRDLLGDRPGAGFAAGPRRTAVFTDGTRVGLALRQALYARGLERLETYPLPLLRAASIGMA
jgi:glutamate racemase